MSLNILSPTSVVVVPIVQVISGSAATVVANSTANTIVTFEDLEIVNVTSSTATLTLQIVRSATTYRTRAYQLNIPAGQNYVAASKDRPIQLDNGDTLQVLSGTASALELSGSYLLLS